MAETPATSEKPARRCPRKAGRITANQLLDLESERATTLAVQKPAPNSLLSPSSGYPRPYASTRPQQSGSQQASANIEHHPWQWDGLVYQSIQQGRVRGGGRLVTIGPTISKSRAHLEKAPALLVLNPRTTKPPTNVIAATMIATLIAPTGSSELVSAA